ncbi:hypothetical protein H4219_000358 [Mycoemilia scoparia]|uniref:Uncharacterized protein n=1 Tax=Mycoemilia scoparia TaxID=417184 RepID=A0A9W8A7C7_9FUNG|nr:hypothetical protein H4219_000358 [Mycoemilia scoparia]
MTSRFSAIRSLLGKRPVLSMAIFSGALAGTGDFMAQFIKLNEEFKQLESQGNKESTKLKFASFALPKYDLLRTARFAVNAALFAPIVFKWHSFLHRKLPIPDPTPGMAIKARIIQTVPPLLRRLIVDQAIFGPLANTVFFTTITLLEGGWIDDIRDKLKRLWWNTYVTGLYVWPTAQAINFTFVPLMYRVPFGSSVSMFWQCYMSWTNSSAPAIGLVPDQVLPTQTH